MRVEEVIEYFGSGQKIHKITGISRVTVTNWKKRGYIPIATQVRLQQMTEGKLRASLEDCSKDE